MAYNRYAPYRFAPWVIVVFLVLIAILGLTGMGAYSPELRIAAAQALVPDIYAHASNYLLSAVSVLGYGILRMLYGPSVRELIVVGLLMIAGNLFYELFLPLWNTQDPIDAGYGIAGVVVAWAYLIPVRLRGIAPDPRYHAVAAKTH